MITKGPYPLGDRLVGMVYFVGNWATDRRAITVAGRRETANLYKTYLIFRRRLVAGRLPSPGDQSEPSRLPVGVCVNCLVGMGLKIWHRLICKIMYVKLSDNYDS